MLGERCSFSMLNLLKHKIYNKRIIALISVNIVPRWDICVLRYSPILIYLGVIWTSKNRLHLPETEHAAFYRTELESCQTKKGIKLVISRAIKKLETINHVQFILSHCLSFITGQRNIKLYFFSMRFIAACISFYRRRTLPCV